MNPLDLYALDQKSFSFLELIGQPPPVRTLNNLSLTGTLTVAGATGTFYFLVLAGTGGGTQTTPSSDFIRVHSGTNQNLGLGSGNAAGSTRVQAYNDAANANIPLEFQGSTLTCIGPFYPSTDAGAAQSASAVRAGTGAPNNANGNNGDIYFRSDGAALTTIYQRRAGAWVGII